ncbi:hypothetical protein V565_263260, partial [Rhizoctonia solani 123E]
MVRKCLMVSEDRILFDSTTMRIYGDAGIVEKRPPEAEAADLDELQAGLDKFDIVKDPYLASNERGSVGWLWWGMDQLPVPKVAQPRNDQSDQATPLWPQFIWSLKESYFPVDPNYKGPPTAYR